MNYSHSVLTFLSAYSCVFLTVVSLALQIPDMKTCKVFKKLNFRKVTTVWSMFLVSIVYVQVHILKFKYLLLESMYDYLPEVR